MPRIESLLSARLFLSPQRVGDHLYFISNLSGRLSLYVMDFGGSVPEPLLPPQIALQNPDLINGVSFRVLPKLGKILVMLDNDGDEKYQPTLIPIEGGYPEPAFGDRLDSYRVACLDVDADAGIAYLVCESRTEQMVESFQAHLDTGELVPLGASKWGRYVVGSNGDNSRVVTLEGYTAGDHVMFLWTRERGTSELLFGTPLEERAEDYAEPPAAIGACWFTPGDRGILTTTALYEDTYGPGYIDLAEPQQIQQVSVEGVQHSGIGELIALEQLHDDRYMLWYNIDGVTWAYEGRFDESARAIRIDQVICGTGELANGVSESISYDKTSDSFALEFCTATLPTQIYTVGGADRSEVQRHTRERVLAIPQEQLAPGEDASFTSHDGLRVSARLYLPSPELGFDGPRPLVYYVHGGPQGQERPNFAWFSMPLIQFLTLNGFAVFVPNARGSTGYGLSYMKHVDRDWGGQDRLDHVHAMQLLRDDPRVDASRAAVVGRSYGGYMTLTLAGRHPELWSAAVDMFGPYDLMTFVDRVPETWKPYFYLAIGDPVKDRDLLVERSPKTYVDDIACPLLVIQGRNDPRVTEQESRDVVERLQGSGKEVEFLLFEDEGHDVLKFDNRVRCYNAITDFFKRTLKP